jgi:sortase A
MKKFFLGKFLAIIFLTFFGSLVYAKNILVVTKRASVNPLPMILKIPEININAKIESLGLAKDGSVAVPVGPSDVAWFDLSVRPGVPGSAVIDGHSGWKDNVEAVFDNLYKLKKGDKIYVQNSDGVTITFIVQSLQSYDAEAKVPAIFNSTDGFSHLNLITCDGIWNPITKTHSQRLVVFSNKE